jgi:alkylation response protein AidB-like acyl-CoA dehydrogenase
MWSTNARTGTMFGLVVKTDPTANPPHKGMTLLIAEKSDASGKPIPGCIISRDLPKLGYKGVESSEVAFEDFPVPIENLVGSEGQGFKYVMAGLEVGRVNIAARAVGVAQAALDAALKYSTERETFGKAICEHQAIQLKLADMATKIEAARLLTRSARAEAVRKSRRAQRRRGLVRRSCSRRRPPEGSRSRRCAIHWRLRLQPGVPGRALHRDAPLMIIGEAPTEIQRLRSPSPRDLAHAPATRRAAWPRDD